MSRTMLLGALLVMAFVAPGAAQTHHRRGGGGGLYRGGIAFNDYGYGPSGGHRHFAGAHTQPGWSALQRYGGFNNYYGGYGGYGRGYSYYQPYFNNWSSSFYLGVGYPYGSFSYYNGPIIGNYYSPYAYSPYYYGYGGLSYYYPDLLLDAYRGPVIDPAPDRVVVPPSLPVEVEVAKPVVTEIDWDARKKADSFIELGDNLFKQQKFHDAHLRYRMAVQASPDYPTAYLRQAFSLIAQRRYEEASQSFAKAFALDPKIIESGFRIDQLYADNRMAREGHEEALAQAALDEPDNSALHFDVGMWLVFNGQAERSRKFFERARELGMKGPVAENATTNGARDL